MLTTKNIICGFLIMATTTCLSADETKKQKRVRPPAPGITRLFVGKLELTDTQKTELKQIDAKFADRFQALVKKQQAVLTDEQKKAQRAAITKAKEEKKNTADIRKDIAAALQLTDKQKTLQKELGKTKEVLNKEVLVALQEVLTEEQLKKLPTRKSGKK